MSHSSSPLLSIIMPTYNSKRFLAESIDSVIRQSVEDWELIVVDDGSSDATLDIVAGYSCRDHRIHVVAETTNKGPAHARNLGLSQARGNLIAFIDSDDIWHPEKTAKQVALMEHHQADISYTGWLRYRDGERVGRRVSVPAEITYQSMLRRCLIACSTAIVRRSTCGAHRMPAIRRRQDHGYWLALLRDGTRRTVGLDEPLMLYRLRADSLSANKLVAARYQWKMLREVEGFGSFRALAFFMGYAYEALTLRASSRTSQYRPFF